MDPSSPTENSEKVHVMESRKQSSNPKYSDLEGTNMTLSGEEDGLITEATQNLLEFAVTKGHTIHSVTHMTRTQLADFLRDYYGKVKVKNDDSLTLKDLRAGLHKFFLEEVSIDILRDRTFELANATFDLALRANPRKCNRMRIEMEDLKKIYLSEAMDTNKPDSLQNKVFFDISLYICNKGKEYFRNMKKNDFDVSTDIHGRRYVWLKDTTNTPNSREDDYPLKLKRGVEEETPTYQVGERMYERPGDPRCPLSSFLKYVTHLHPMTDAFWQRPKRNVSQSDYVWYDHTPLGSSTLTKIMQRISLQAGLSDNYTNYSIRSACIPLVEAVCEEALRKENGGVAPSQNSVPTVDIIKPPGPVMSHSTSEEISSDDGLSQASDMQSAKDFDRNGGSVRVKPPGISVSSSVGSGSMDADDSDIYGLMQAKTQVLDLIRGLMVKDIQKFVDWLKTVRVQYSAGELIVLCSPVDKSNVEPIPDDITVDRNGVPSRNGTPDPTFKKSGSLDLSEKRQKLKKESSVKEEDKLDLPELTGTTIKQVDFSSVAGVHCSSDEFGPMKISVPTHDTLLVTGIPENLQLMMHKKRGQNGHRESLISRVFCSENEMDVAEVVAVMGTHNKKAKQRNGHAVNNHVASSNGISSSPYHVVEHQVKHQTTVLHRSPHQVMVTIPAAHTPIMSTLSAREHFKDHRNKSMGCLETPPLLPEGMASLKRVSSTGTPVLKRQAHVIEPCAMYPENLTVKRPRDDNLQATNLSMKPLKKTESQEAKRARADRLADSLRYHQEILQNSPLIKRPGERNFSGFRHCYANTVGNSVKPEPLDTSYS
ncbi:uncharacterized protein LOC101859972 [Aplysia californica]|uniref:Uncharacterized protein LOC101859972 n=1 Tax=Aplysia californica TaxID=6500 RepID=A0ABM0K4N4_APLCA|nr:uncharacterized protein LOC101859972 [Aplysia californica]